MSKDLNVLVQKYTDAQTEEEKILVLRQITRKSQEEYQKYTRDENGTRYIAAAYDSFRKIMLKILEKYYAISEPSGHRIYFRDCPTYISCYLCEASDSRGKTFMSVLLGRLTSMRAMNQLFGFPEDTKDYTKNMCDTVMKRMYSEPELIQSHLDPVFKKIEQYLEHHPNF